MTIVERMPVHPGSLFFQEHLARYKFALERVRSGRLLDIACGTGYGADLFAHLPGFLAVGVDVDGASVYAARKAFPNPMVRFCIASGTELPFTRDAFRNIVSLETIEHVEDDRGLLREFLRVLAPDGVCILSTPNRLYSAKHGIENPYHVREYEEDELRDLLGQFFRRVTLFHQGFGDRYHNEVRGYRESIRAGKQSLPSPLRVVVQRVYRPAKKLIPVHFRNYAIRKLLKVEYPQPDQSDIAIWSGPMAEPSNFVVMCEEPR